MLKKDTDSKSSAEKEKSYSKRVRRGEAEVEGARLAHVEDEDDLGVGVAGHPVVGAVGVRPNQRHQAEGEARNELRDHQLRGRAAEDEDGGGREEELAHQLEHLEPEALLPAGRRASESGGR